MTTNTSSVQHTLFYAHDPMCSWCWGFKPYWQQLKQALPETVDTQYVLGGLAPDTDEPMPEQMQRMLQQYWHQIAQTIPGTEFNHAFWTQNSPRRATYPACRAVIAAKAQGHEFEESMITAIQQAYYLHAKNPSNDDTLIALADDIGCDVHEFKQALNSDVTHASLKENLLLVQRLGASGFPSLFFKPVDKNPIALALSYTNPQSILDQIDTIFAE